ncbi:hypothetical protein M885DRAFT_544661 [Pelagophyceae sp. CCMP2097]|nr:hypothetical protein M885DRAFT_544661 [Pelagophyceae sp. CCMP2097]
MDLKALMRAGKAKSAGASRDDVRLRADALRRKRAADKDEAERLQRVQDEKRVLSSMPPPPPRFGGASGGAAMPPPPPVAKRAVPRAFLEPAPKETPAPKPPPPAAHRAVPSGLPAGFFDDAAAVPAGLVGDYSDDSDDDGAAQQAAPKAAAAAPAENGAARPSDNALPSGFFDDKEADMRARGIDPEKKKAKDADVAWNEFEAFAGDIQKKEAVDNAVEADEVEDEAQRRALEQAWYERKLGLLLARADAPRKSAAVNDTFAHGGAAAPEQLPRSLTEGAEDSEAPIAATDLAGLLRAKKRRRQAAAKVAQETDYAAFDEADSWRAMAI